MITSAEEHSPGVAGLAPAFAAARARLGLIALLFGLAAVGWWWTVDQMRGMDDGPWTGLGTFSWFAGVWVVMMAAMMFPSLAPTVAFYSRMTKARSPASPLVAGLTAFEKLIPFRRTGAYVTAAILPVLGVLLLAAPDLIPALTLPGSGDVSDRLDEPLAGVPPSAATGARRAPR